MTPKTILLPVHVSQPDSDIRAAIEFCRARDYHLVVLMIGLMPAPPIAVDTVILSDSWPGQVEEARAALVERADAVEQMLLESGISADEQRCFVMEGGLERAVSRYAMFSDLVIALRTLPETSAIADHVHAGVLLGSGKPMLVATPQQIEAPDFSSALLAWNNDKPGAVTISLVMDQLAGADSVRILVVDPDATESQDGEAPGWDLATYLARHGMSVTVDEAASGGHDVADVIKARAKETGASFIVMGGYGHARLRQRLFGGTTYEMLAACDLPVFMAH